MSAIKREGNDLEELLRQANSSLTQYLQHPDVQKYIIPEPSHQDCSIEAVQISLQRLSFFDQLEDYQIETQFTQKRRDDFFKKYKKDQEEKLISRKKAVERHYYLRDSAPKLLRG
jgi:hypothetical protein